MDSQTSQKSFQKKTKKKEDKTCNQKTQKVK